MQPWWAVCNNFNLRGTLWLVIIHGWTWRLSPEIIVYDRRTDRRRRAGWWSGRTEPLCWTGRKSHPRRNPATMPRRRLPPRSDCRARPTAAARRDARGLGGAADLGVPLRPAGPKQTAAAPRPRPRNERCRPTRRSISRIQGRGRRRWRTGWWSGRKRTRLCLSL